MNQNENQGASQDKEISESDLELLHVIRESFRTPLGESKLLIARIGGKSFEVENIGSGGIGIRIPRADLFHINQKLDAIQLVWEKDRFAIEGRVIHISPEETGKYLCGIRFVHLDKKSEKKLNDQLQKCRTRLFSKKGGKQLKGFKGLL